MSLEIYRLTCKRFFIFFSAIRMDKIHFRLEDAAVIAVILLYYKSRYNKRISIQSQLCRPGRCAGGFTEIIYKTPSDLFIFWSMTVPTTPFCCKTRIKNRIDIFLGTAMLPADCLTQVTRFSSISLSKGRYMTKPGFINNAVANALSSQLPKCAPQKNQSSAFFQCGLTIFQPLYFYNFADGLFRPVWQVDEFGNHNSHISVNTPSDLPYFFHTLIRKCLLEIVVSNKTPFGTDVIVDCEK